MRAMLQGVVTGQNRCNWHRLKGLTFATRHCELLSAIFAFGISAAIELTQKEFQLKFLLESPGRLFDQQKLIEFQEVLLWWRATTGPHCKPGLVAMRKEYAGVFILIFGWSPPSRKRENVPHHLAGTAKSLGEQPSKPIVMKGFC